MFYSSNLHIQLISSNYLYPQSSDDTSRTYGVFEIQDQEKPSIYRGITNT